MNWLFIYIIGLLIENFIYYKRSPESPRPVVKWYNIHVMKQQKALRFRLYPNEEQRIYFAKSFGCCRYIYNIYLAMKQDVYQKTKTSLSYVQMAKDLTQRKQVDDFLQEVDSAALQQALRDLDRAYKNFFEHRAKLPRFKSKHKSRKAFRTPNNQGSVKVLDGFLKIPKCKPIKMKQHRPIPENWELGSATISQTATGKYYVSLVFTYENQVQEHSDTTKTIGLDFSMKELYIDNKGQEPCMPHPYREAEKRLAKAQCKLSKMYKKGQKQSHRYIKQLHKVARLHEKVKNQRADFLHKLSRELVDMYDYICIEDLNMQGMSQALHFGKSVHDNGWGMFTDMLEYKAKESGKHVIKVDRFFASSQTCSVCGVVSPITKDLSVREWTCPGCGTHHHRDVNAAINIKNEGLRLAFA